MLSTNKETTPTVGIILVNYNNAEDTLQCVLSIKKQTIRSWFIVIVDNASIRVEELYKLNSNANIKLLFNVKNEGFGKANNIGAEWCVKNINPSYLFILNNDTLLQPDTLEKLVWKFENETNPQTTLIAPLILTMNTNHIWYAGGHFNKNRISINMAGLDQTDNHEKYVDFASGCAMFFRTSEYVRLNGFDENIFIYDEDVEISIRIAKQKKQILFYPAAVVQHKKQGSQIVSEISNQLNPKYPNLLFYLSNTLINRVYIINIHYDFFSFINIIGFIIYLFAKSVQYLIYFKYYAVRLCLKTIMQVILLQMKKSIKAYL